MRRSLATIALVGAIICVTSVFLPKSPKAPEPWHKSKKVSFRVEGVKYPNRSADLFVDHVIEIGSPAVPYIVRSINQQRSTLRRAKAYRWTWSHLPEFV